MLLDKQNMMVNGVNLNGAVFATAYIADPSAAGLTLPIPAGSIPGASIGSIDLGLGALLPRRTTGMTLLAMISGAALTGFTTLTINILNAVDAAGGTPTTVATSGAIAAAAVIPGAEIPIEIPDSVKLTKRFLCAQITGATANASSATILDLGLAPDGDRQTSQV